MLAAAATRVPELMVTDENQAIAYVLPAVMFGYMGAILYDPRTALLLRCPWRRSLRSPPAIRH